MLKNIEQQLIMPIIKMIIKKNKKFNVEMF